MDKQKIKSYIQFQINRNIISLYKKYFEITEDLYQEHQSLLSKVEEETSSDFSKNIDYFDEKKYNYIRKKILDAGNDAIRTIDSSFQSIDILLK